MKRKSIICGLMLFLVFCSCLYLLHYNLQSKDSNLDILGTNLNQEIKNNDNYKIYKTESKNDITYNVVDFERNLAYSWTFAKEKTDTPLNQTIEMDINLRLDIDAITNTTNDINELVKENKLIVSFDYHGDLPTKALVKINVKDKFKDGEHLYLYYYNPDNKQIEFIDKNIKVKDGYIEFNIEHCSDYFLTASVVNEAVNNPKSINYIIIGLGAIVFILIAITLVQSKK